MFTSQTPFQAPAELNGLQKLLAGLSETVAKLSAILLVAVAAAIAALGGGQLPCAAPNPHPAICN